jgi:hypothetical protein
MVMNLCNDGHAEVCYDQRSCPACDAIGDKDSEIANLRDEIKELESRLRDAEAAIEED